MQQFSGKHLSYWIDSTPRPDFPTLAGGASAEVAVVGAGIVGLTAAVLLKRSGRTVAVVESRKVAEQVTGHTTAKVTSLHGLIYGYLLRQFGEETARRYGESNQAGLEQIATLVQEMGIDCDFERTAAYTYSRSGERLQEIHEEVEAASRVGLPATFVRESSLPFAIAGAVRFDHQAQFHPRKYLLPLAQSLPGDGSAVYENTRVLDIEEGSPCRVLTDHGTIAARDVIIATNLPILYRGLFFAKAFPRRHLIASAPIDEARAPEGMFLGVDSPTFSIRTQRNAGGRLLVVVGPSFKPGADTEQQYRELTRFMRTEFGVEDVRYWWGNQDYDPVDRIPYIGHLTSSSKHLYTATGFKGWGMTAGTLAGQLLADAICQHPNPWASLYDATRIDVMPSASTFLARNLGAATAWVGDRIRQPRLRLADLDPGEGGLVLVGGEKVAAYRDEQGQLHGLSPVCTHLRCLVSWNRAERTWDCPCHGSRFDTEGRVISGPAVKDLPTKSLDES